MPDQETKPDSPSETKTAMDLFLKRVDQVVKDRLAEMDSNISKREDAKISQMLESIINRAQQNQAQRPTGSTGNTGGGLGQYLDIARSFGLIGNEPSGMSPMEQRMASLLTRGYENFLRAQEREFARKLGIPVHEGSSDHV